MPNGSHGWWLVVQLLTLLACGDDTSAPADASADSSEPARDAEPDAEQPEGYVLCDDSDSIRLAVISTGGQLEPMFEFTNPYGHSFVFVTGKCEYLAGKSLVRDEVRRGTLGDAQAKAITRDLALSKLPDWSTHRDQSCPDASVFYIRSALGYGECSCGCDEDAPAGLSQVVDAANLLADRLSTRGTLLDGAVELIAVETERQPGESYQTWPIDLDLAEIAIKEASLYNGEPLPAPHTLRGTDASLARELRVTAFEMPGRDHEQLVRVQTDATQTYALYIRDQVPAGLASAIAEFGNPPGF